jgi:hypothetical protein
MEEIGRSWANNQFTTLDSIRKALNKPNLSQATVAAGTEQEDVLFQAILKKEVNMLTATETQFSSMVENLVKVALFHPEFAKQVSLQFTEVYFV